MAFSPTDLELLAPLIPINALSAEHLRTLADKATIGELPSGHVLFQEGSTDSNALYVLAGDVVLSSKKRWLTPALTCRVNSTKVKRKGVAVPQQASKNLTRD